MADTRFSGFYCSRDEQAGLAVSQARIRQFHSRPILAVGQSETEGGTKLLARESARGAGSISCAKSRSLATRLWNVCAARSGMMALSGLRRSCCSTSLGFLNAVGEPARAGVWRNDWPNWGGRLCTVRGLTRGGYFGAGSRILSATDPPFLIDSGDAARQTQTNAIWKGQHHRWPSGCLRR